MRFAAWVALSLSLVGLGCHSIPVEPGLATIYGTVRYADGSAVSMAKVEPVGGKATFTDRSGHYQLQVSAPGGTVTLTARDGYTPGVAYAVTHFGRAVVVVDRPRIMQDIILDQAAPI